MKAVLMAYSVADTLQWKSEIEGETTEDLTKKSLAIIQEKSITVSKKVVLKINGKEEVRWIQEKLCTPRSPKKVKQV